MSQNVAMLIIVGLVLLSIMVWWLVCAYSTSHTVMWISLTLIVVVMIGCSIPIVHQLDFQRRVDIELCLTRGGVPINIHGNIECYER